MNANLCQTPIGGRVNPLDPKHAAKNHGLAVAPDGQPLNRKARRAAAKQARAAKTGRR